jgi:hypothetical protein
MAGCPASSVLGSYAYAEGGGRVFLQLSLSHDEMLSAAALGMAFSASSICNFRTADIGPPLWIDVPLWIDIHR